MENIIKLKYPIEINGVETHELEMRRPTVRDLLDNSKATGTDQARELALIGNLCQSPPVDLEKLDWSDYMQLRNKLDSFLDLSQR